MKLKRKKFKKYAVVVPLVVLAAVAIWLIVTHRTDQTPQQIFDDMLAQNLSVDKFGKDISSNQNGTSLNQKVAVDVSARRSRWTVVVSQGGSSVTTESLGTKGSGYVRYMSVKAPDKIAVQKYQDILYKWGKSDGHDGLAKLNTQALVDVNSAPLPPLGRLNDKSKKQLLDFVKQNQVFKADFAKATSIRYHGHPAYRYDVSVDQANYMRLMQKFVKAIGVQSTISDFDAGKLAKAPAVSIELTVDKSSHRLLSASYPKKHYEVAYDYSVNQSFSLPKQTMPVARLQQLAAQ